jgi:ATP phosphoribosyltransferase
VLNLTIPTGSLEAFTLKLFEEADLPILRASERDYNARIADPRFAKVKFLRPPEIPGAVRDGHFDLGLCGVHSIREARADVVEAMDLGPGGRAGGNPRLVLAAPAGKELPRPVRVATEFPNLAQDYFAAKGIDAKVIFSHGATEAKIPELADAIVEITESGSSLRRAGLDILDELSPMNLRLIANKETWADPERRDAIEEVKTLLGGVLEARGKVLLKMNVPKERLEELLSVLPAAKEPTISPLALGNYFAVESVAVKATVNVLIPELKKHGAEDILELPISKIVA